MLPINNIKYGKIMYSTKFESLIYFFKFKL
jgi:hypothetical protein